MLLYAITSRVLLAQTEAERAEKLLALAACWAANGVDFIQIREKDLADAELLGLASSVVRAAHATGSRTTVLINAPPDAAAAIALESGADGVHLPGSLHPGQLFDTVIRIQELWRIGRNSTTTPPISVSCHSVADVQAARAAGVTLALFGPVFEKALPGSPSLAGLGLESLAEACRVARQDGPQPELPILALGGVTGENSSPCVSAGASGIASIRLFLNTNREPGWR